MNFTHYHLGHVERGSIVEVTLQGSAANVRLMDSSNFNSYKARRRHHYNGGLAKRSPIRLPVPNSGNWHVTVDMQGLCGTVRSGIRVIPSSSLSPPTSEAPDGRTFDVFISHTSEDKDEIVRPLATALQDAGLKVWYDEFELRIGDSLRKKIDMGLARSRFGIVVLSQAFLGRGWPEYELDGLVTRAVAGDQILLPIWHNISKREVIDYSPSLADRLARSTATHTVEEIAAEIVDLIRNPVAV